MSEKGKNKTGMKFFLNTVSKELHVWLTAVCWYMALHNFALSFWSQNAAATWLIYES